MSHIFVSYTTTNWALFFNVSETHIFVKTIKTSTGYALIMKRSFVYLWIYYDSDNTIYVFFYNKLNGYKQIILYGQKNEIISSLCFDNIIIKVDKWII